VPIDNGCGNVDQLAIAAAGFAVEEARRVGAEIGVNWPSAPFDVEQFRMGMEPIPNREVASAGGTSKDV
jgi:hypothetical protein